MQKYIKDLEKIKKVEKVYADQEHPKNRNHFAYNEIPHSTHLPLH